MSFTLTPTREVEPVDDGAVRWVVLHRPASKNGLTVEVNGAIMAALAEAGADPKVRVVALYGHGGAFSSGLDLKAAASQPQTAVETETRMRSHFHGLIRAVRACPIPVIAMIDGAAAGFGCDLALAADLRFCSARARFGEIFVRRGLMPDGGGTYFLPRIVGLGRAIELMLTGDIVEADEALRIGLANRVVPVEGFLEAAHAYAQRLAAGPPLVHRAVKHSVYAALDGTLDAALENEVRGQLRLLGSADFFEGVTAFLSKRDPQFKGQ